MKKYLLPSLALITMFCLGFAFKSIITSEKTDVSKPRATGIGGIFFKAKDPAKLRQWYQDHLGLNTNKYGAVFEWYQGADSTQKGFSQWSPFGEKTKYFAPSEKDFMINYRVAKMDELVLQLKKAGIVFTDSVQSFDYGKFVHILDLEGNKLELWEPNDVVYENMGKQMGAKTTK